MNKSVLQMTANSLAWSSFVENLGDTHKEFLLGIFSNNRFYEYFF